MNNLSALVVVLLLLNPLHSFGAERFIDKVKCSSGQTVVVAEGDFEARSLGSFSVRLYDTAAGEDETTFYLDGIVAARRGTIEKIVRADIDGDTQPEIIVISRSVGTGGYLSAHAFTCTKNKLTLRATVVELPSGADPVIALQKTTVKTQ